MVLPNPSVTLIKQPKDASNLADLVTAPLA